MSGRGGGRKVSEYECVYGRDGGVREGVVENVDTESVTEEERVEGGGVRGRRE